MIRDDLEYVGFLPRVAACLLDTLLVAMVITPLLHFFYGEVYSLHQPIFRGPADFFLSWLFPPFLCIWFWFSWQSTPGKKAFGAMIVDAQTGGRPGIDKLIIRYFGYLVAFLPLGLGILWILFDSKKRGWHDLMAGTVVVRKRKRRAVEFGEQSSI